MKFALLLAAGLSCFLIFTRKGRNSAVSLGRSNFDWMVDSRTRESVPLISWNESTASLEVEYEDKDGRSACVFVYSPGLGCDWWKANTRRDLS